MRSLRRTVDYDRIAALPVRPVQDLDQIAAKLTAALAAPGLSFPLRDVQALALHDAGTVGGLFAPIRVGGGKCLGRDTPILLFDGTIKMVQDVKPGDRLMGPDSRPRTVKTVCCGREPLYKIVPVKGSPFVVNVSHILSLKRTPQKPNQTHAIENISVRDLLRKSLHWRANAKLWRTGVDFEASSTLPMPTYILGLWLGDGTSSGPSITTIDHKISSAFIAWGLSLGLHYRQTGGKRFRQRSLQETTPQLELLEGWVCLTISIYLSSTLQPLEKTV
jgi:hypothetical protein